MKNQYKIEVDQISLSESFKQSLKEKMAAEYAAEAANTLKTKKSFNFSKYSKYIATAAIKRMTPKICFVLNLLLTCFLFFISS